jgi:hypothetical protein
MAKATASLALLFLFAVLASTADAGASGAITLRLGESLAVEGTNLVCGSTELPGGAAFSCLQRTPSGTAIRADSLGVGLSTGTAERVSILYVDARGSVSLRWVRSQPAHGARATFPGARGTRALTASPGDRVTIAGTNLACVVAEHRTGSVITCAEVATSTLEPIPGTYAVAADATRVEIERVTRTGPFQVVAGYLQPWVAR